MNALLLLSLFTLILCPTGLGQESLEVLRTHEVSSQKSTTTSSASAAVQVKSEYLNNVSTSLLMAESWVRAHVLAYYPLNNVTTILVGEPVLCTSNGESVVVEEKHMDLILPSVKNIYYSLTRWGLQNDIKVATSFASHCLDPKFETHLKPLFNTLQEIGSPFVVKPSPNLHMDHLKMGLKSVGLHNMDILVVSGLSGLSGVKGYNNVRKLLYIDLGALSDTFPSRPTPITPTRSPAFAANSPLPPLIGTVSPVSSPPFVKPATPPFVNPATPPFVNPATPPFGPHLPPCNPSAGGAPAPFAPAAPIAPVAPVHSGVWCVAKPSVPAETLQEALDYACGEGGADCEAITPQGSCYFPDTLVAHASYAFNSYWQKTKGNGGSCGFGGTAMLINSDPSYRHCRFTLN